MFFLFSQPYLPYTVIGLLASAIIFLLIKDHIKPYIKE